MNLIKFNDNYVFDRIRILDSYKSKYVFPTLKEIKTKYAIDNLNVEIKKLKSIKAKFTDKYTKQKFSIDIDELAEKVAIIELEGYEELLKRNLNKVITNISFKIIFHNLSNNLLISKKDLNNRIELKILIINHKKLMINEKREKQFEKNNLNKLFSELLKGNKIIVSEDTKDIVWKTENLIIKLNKITKTFDLYYLKIEVNFRGEINKSWKYFGGFRTIKRYLKKIITIDSNIRTDKLFSIELKSIAKKDDEDTAEFDLLASKYAEIGKFLKVGTTQDQVLHNAYTELFDWFKNSDLIETETKSLTNRFGVFGKKHIYLPNKYDLNLNAIEGNLSEEVVKFIEHFQIEHNYTKEDTIKAGNILYKYINLSIRARITLSYSLISIFQQYIKRDRKLLSIYNLVNMSNQSNTGKSTIVRLCNTQLLTGYNSNGHTGEILKGTTQRFTNEQILSFAFPVDDIQEITNRTTIDLVKTTSTQIIGIVIKYPNNKKTIYVALRNLIGSCNRFLIKDPNLADRFMILDYNNKLILKKELEVSENLLLKLEEHLYIIRDIIWNNIDTFIKLLDNKNIDTKRENSNDTILNLGQDLLYKLFELLGVDTKDLKRENYTDYLTNPREKVITDETNLRESIEWKLLELTSIKFSHKELSDPHNPQSELLMYNQEYNYQYLTKGKNNIVIDKIKENALQKGIHIKDEHNKIILRLQTSIIPQLNKGTNLNLQKLNDLSNFIKGEYVTKKINGNTAKCFAIEFKKELVYDDEIENLLEVEQFDLVNEVVAQ